MTVPAIGEARRRSRSPVPTSEPGFCKREVRECLSLNLGRVIVSRSADAASCWANAKRKHQTADPAEIPRGAPVFWLGGSEGRGHVTIATGNSGHWTTDLLRPGFFDRTGIALVSRRWESLRLVGWTEDFDGETVMRDGKPVIAKSLGSQLLGAHVLDDQVDHLVDDREGFVDWQVRP